MNPVLPEKTDLIILRYRQWAIADSDINILIVVSKRLAVNGQATDMFCRIGNGHFEFDTAFGGQIESVN